MAIVVDVLRGVLSAFWCFGLCVLGRCRIVCLKVFDVKLMLMEGGGWFVFRALLVVPIDESGDTFK